VCKVETFVCKVETFVAGTYYAAALQDFVIYTEHKISVLSTK